MGRKPRIIIIANESQGVTQSDIVNNKQHLAFFVNYSPTKVICERRIRSFFSDLDDHFGYKLSGQRTKKAQEAWATLEAGSVHNLLSYLRRLWRRPSTSKIQDIEDLKKLWESNDDRSDAGMPRPEPASSGKSLTE